MGRARYTDEQQAFYAKYLKSRAWREKKEQRIAQAGGRCEFATLREGPRGFAEYRCGRTTGLQVHHNTYERLGAEMAKDLDVYCWFHHLVEHLLWKKCRRCTRPCLEHDEAAEKWLAAALAVLRIDPDQGPVAWTKLPNKEYFLAEVSDYCQTCLPATDKEFA